METMQIPVNFNQTMLINLFGINDENINLIEKKLKITVTYRDNNLTLKGQKENIEIGEIFFEKSIKKINKGEKIDIQFINYFLDTLNINDKQLEKINNLSDNVICLTTSGQPIIPKTFGQKKYIDSIKKNIITFGIGPAGTGKTYLAMALAITAFKKNEVNKIILTRPAIEAGEKLGFLPGDLQQKVDPYLRPLYDALNKIMGNESFLANMEKGLIEVAPLAYMRGRTLDNAYIILDEAQNTTKEQMKMFLTRIGFGSKAIITGDTTQTDLIENKISGLVHATKILKKVDGIGISMLTNKDVVRHPLVQKIIKAYEIFEKK